MTLQLLTRRALVVAGVVVSLVVGAASIQAAAAWTAASAPLNDPPASLASLQASLEQERARSLALIAVFSPIVFLEGTTGRLFREFGLVIAGAVAISAFAGFAFSLYPAYQASKLDPVEALRYE